MKSLSKILLSAVLVFASSLGLADTQKTQRINQFENHKVKVWQTVIYPDEKEKLKMHHHDRDRVMVALTDGELKVMNDKGQSHILKLEKGQSYFLTKDVPMRCTPMKI